ncbi:MAG: ferredoxin [Actinomycetota bacterium]
MKVRIDPIRCTGHGTCVAVSGRVFKQDDWGYAYVAVEFQDAHLPEELELEVCVAANRCPEGAIDTVAGPTRWLSGPWLPRTAVC